MSTPQAKRWESAKRCAALSTAGLLLRLGQEDLLGDFVAIHRGSSVGDGIGWTGPNGNCSM